MAFLSKNEILSAEDFRFASVSCPEWGGEVRVRGLTAYEQSVITKLITEDKKHDVTLKVVQFGCVDENGERLFSTADVDQLRKKSFAVIERLGEKILKLTGVGDADEVESLKKN